MSNQMPKKNVRLGQSTNLLRGFSASWLDAKTGNTAIIDTKNKVFEDVEQAPPKNRGKWSYPFVSFHEDAASLLNTLLPFSFVEPAEPVPATHLPTGTLLLASEGPSAINKISKTLGVDFSKTDTGFVLAMLKRTDGAVVHPLRKSGVPVHPHPVSPDPQYNIRREFLAAAGKLKREKIFSPDKITPGHANTYLAFFDDWGSHFVSGITYGDVIFQVFAMPHKKFRHLQDGYKDDMRDLQGTEKALDFRQYTEASDEDFGYVSEYGKLLNLSGSGVLSTDIKTNSWHDINAGTTSVFAPFDYSHQKKGQPHVTLLVLNEKYQDTTEISAELTSLWLLMEISRKKMWRQIFKGAAIQKWRGTVEPQFIKYGGDYTLPVDSKAEIKGLLSRYATPTVSAYKPRFDLSDLIFLNPEEVKEFTLFSNYLTNAPGKVVSVPGKDVMICAQEFNFESSKHIPALRLTDEAFQNVRGVFQQFHGAMRIEDTSGKSHCSIVDGLRYSDKRDAPGGIYADVWNTELNTKSVIERCRNSLHFCYAFAEGRLAVADLTTEPSKNREFLLNTYRWIASIIPSESADDDLGILRIRALERSRTPVEKLGVFIPVLTAEEYQTQITRTLGYLDDVNRNLITAKREIEDQKRDEKLTRDLTAMNKNIIASGKKIYEYTGTRLEKQQNLSRFYKGVVEGDKATLESLRGTIINLWGEVIAAHGEVDTAVTKLRQGLHQAKETAELKAAFDIAKNLFDIGKSIASKNPGGAVTGLFSLVQNIRGLMKVLNGVWDVYDDKNPGKLANRIQKAEQNFTNATQADLANIQYDQLDIQMETALQSLTKGKGVDAQVRAVADAFKIYVMKGKAYNTALFRRHELARKVFESQQRKVIVDKQIKRLKATNEQFKSQNVGNLDKTKIDLVGFTGMLEMAQSQCLSVLVEAYLKKDQALQYQTLQSPTSLSQFSTLGLKSAIAVQEGKRNSAKTELRTNQPSTETVTYSVKIPTEKLERGVGYEFDIPLNAREFQRYSTVRVEKLVAKIDGIESVDGNQYSLQLRCLGHPFSDRWKDQVHEYYTPSRQKIYNYEIGKSDIADDGGSWSEGVNPITPFSTWEIALPQSKKKNINQNIKFKRATAHVTLKFTLSARTHWLGGGAGGIQAPPIGPAGAAKVQPEQSKGNLLSQMKGQSVMQGWDVVFNMSLNKINEELERQFDQAVSKSTSVGEFRAFVEGREKEEKYYTRKEGTELSFKYSHPKLQFLTNNSKAVRLEFKVTSEESQERTVYVGNKTQDRKKVLRKLELRESVENDDNDDRDEKDKATITLDKNKLTLTVLGKKKTYSDKDTIPLKIAVPLSAAKGDTEHTDTKINVLLDLVKGATDARKFNLTSKKGSKEQRHFSQEMTNHFRDNDVSFIINSLDMKDHAQLASLTPKNFWFVLNDQQEMLQLFIATGSSKFQPFNKASLSNDVTNPIPIGYDTSLMISSKILFNSILPASVTQTDWKMEGQGPKKTSAVWHARFTKASFSAEIDLSEMNHTDGSGDNYLHHSYAPKKTPTEFDLGAAKGGMVISAVGSGMLALKHDSTSKFHFIDTMTGQTCSQRLRLPPTSKGESSTCLETSPVGPTNEPESIDIKITIKSVLEVSIDGTGRDQKVKIIRNSSTSDIKASASGGGSCVSPKWKDRINDKVKAAADPKLTKALEFTANSVSVFALKNLLFPNGNPIDLKEVYIPGDLLLLGNFNEKT